MLKLGRVTQFKMLFLVLVFVFNFDLFKFSAAILEKGLFLRIPQLEIQNNFYNRFASPNKHQVLSFRRDFLCEFGEQF